MRLEAARIVEPNDRLQFDLDFTASQRTKAHPRPGLACEFVWPLSEAQKLDQGGQFVEAVRAGLNQLLTALSAPSIACFPRAATGPNPRS
jgi:hypothetical protein